MLLLLKLEVVGRVDSVFEFVFGLTMLLLTQGAGLFSVDGLPQRSVMLTPVPGSVVGNQLFEFPPVPWLLSFVKGATQQIWKIVSHQ